MSHQTEQTSALDADETMPITKPKHELECERLVNPDSEEVKIRCFYNTDGRVFLAVLLKETDDSFLVGAATRLVMMKPGVITSETISTEPVLRVMKSSVSYMTTASIKSMYYYCTFLLESGRMYLPDLLTDEFMDNITNYVQQYEERNSVKSQAGEPIEQPEMSVGMSEVPGASDKHFVALQRSDKVH